MFKSSGYFKAVSCPFFIRGCCSRPYCHFRHAKTTVSDSLWPKDLHCTAEGSASQEGTFPLDDIITTSDWASGLAKDEADLSAPVKPSYSVTRGKNPLSRTAPKQAVTSIHQSANSKKVAVNSKPDAVSDSNSDFYDVFGSDSENDTGVDEPVQLPVGGNKSGVSTDEDFEQFVKREVTNGEEELQKAEEIFQKAIQSSSIESKRSVENAKLNSGFAPPIKKLAGDGGPNKGPKALSKKPTEDLALTRFKNTGRKRQRKAHVVAQVVRNPVVSSVSSKPQTDRSSSYVLPESSDMFVGKKRKSYQVDPSLLEGEDKITRPRIPVTPNAKIPSSIRQRFLDCFIEEYLKTTNSDKEAFEKALSDEKMLFTRAKSKMLYTNVASNHLRKLRTKSSSNSSEPVVTGRKRKLSGKQKPTNSSLPPKTAVGNQGTASGELTQNRRRLASGSDGKSKRKSILNRKGLSSPVGGVSTAQETLPQRLKPVGILYTVPGKEGQYFISHTHPGEVIQNTKISHDQSHDLSHDLFGSSDED